ncbi:shikimate kinase [Kribbella sp. NPDC004536]|uniref:shikimate kinase n=1 Tax=Kribbella sp. NPDC004536 TaxID=3364106 RepID=UPI0036B77B01
MRVLLIGGTSNVGKSTVAQVLAQRLAFSYVSTDQLGRHPGRPWPDPPAHVTEHYRSLTASELLDALLAHYTRMQPRVQELVAQSTGLVLEGSGVWPPYVTAPAVWLTADEALITTRIHTSSQYAALTPDRRHLVDKFVARTLAYQAKLLTHTVPHVDVTNPRTPDELADEVLSLC